MSRARVSRILTYLKKDCADLKETRSFLESWEKTGTAETDMVWAPDLEPFSFMVSGER